MCNAARIASPVVAVPVSSDGKPALKSIRVGRCGACKAMGAADKALCPHCPGCGRLRPAGRIIFCSQSCADVDCSLWAGLLDIGDQVDMPFLCGSATRIAGTKPGDALYHRTSVAPVLHVRVVREVRNRAGHLISLLAADVHGRRATQRQRIGMADLEGWTPYGRIGADGAFEQIEGSRP